MDLLRLEVGPAFQFTPPATTLHRQTILGPDQKPIWIYYRQNQRRQRVETDGEFCLSQAETGQLFPNNQPPRGTAIAVKQKALDAATVMVRPWWIYRDYRAPSPKQRYGLDWGSEASGYSLIKEMVFEPDGANPTTEVRVCREEAGAADVGHIYASGRGGPPPAKGPPGKKGAPGKGAAKPAPVIVARPAGPMRGLAKTPPLQDRLRPPPNDTPYAAQHKGQEVPCRGNVAETMSVDCGCGVGLEHCLPGDGFAQVRGRSRSPRTSRSGSTLPFAAGPQNASSWNKLWWSQEVRHFFGKVFGADRDFREVLTGAGRRSTGRWRSSTAPARRRVLRARARLQDVRRARAALQPGRRPRRSAAHGHRHVGRRRRSRAARGGLVTMPAFLAKYASRRARAAAVYNVFLCKSFTAENHLDLQPSTEPNLMVREGCSTCHATLEPLAAYFSRVEETSWVFLPPPQFPVQNAVCKKNAQGKMPGFCESLRRRVRGRQGGKLRGAYAAPEHAERGPAGLAADVAAQPEFASCAVERVTSSFLGRPLRDDDRGCSSRCGAPS